LCGDVKPGGGRTHKCLEAHNASLAPECLKVLLGTVTPTTTRMTKPKPKPKPKLSSGSEAWQEENLKAVHDLTSAASLNPMPVQVRIWNGVDGACDEDKRKFCSDVKPGGGRTHKCLEAHAKELSEACRGKATNKAESEGSLQVRADQEAIDQIPLEATPETTAEGGEDGWFSDWGLSIGRAKGKTTLILQVQVQVQHSTAHGQGPGYT
jgi:hypothetical protein